MDNFIVSARKYRPATFVSVIGQSHITSTLKNAIGRGQLAHAYLFCGPRGVGKTTCARIFAKAINCLDPKDAEACNECESCKSFNEGRSFNIHELDAASNNSVDDIRNLTDQVRIPPQIGRYSVYIIDEVHMLSLQAFNAFLKTLEEPPAHAVFILATTEKHKIIPTILSRCQIYDFNRIRVEDTVSYLKYIAGEESVHHDEESLHVIARKADGGMRDALSMFDKVVSFCGPELSGSQVAATLNVLDYDTYFAVTDQFMAGSYTDALMLFDEVLRKGFSGQTFVAGLNDHFRDLLMCKNPQTLPLLEVSGSIAERYKSQAAACSVPLLFEGINLLTELDASFRTATNQRLHVELGLMKLCGLGQKKNSDDLTPTLPPLVKPTERISSGQPIGDNMVSPESVQPKRPGVSSPASTPGRSQVAEAISLATSTGKDQSPEGATSKDSGPATRPEAPVTAKEPDREQKLPGETSPRSPRMANGFSLSGASISSLLKVPAAEETREPDGDATGEVREIDEHTEERLVRGCARFATELMATRPRLGVAFREVSVQGNKVSIRVPNESLQDEVMRNLPEMQKHLSELSRIHVPIQFEIKIEADTAGLKPVRVEDRLRFLTEKNPLLSLLRKELDLDVE